MEAVAFDLMKHIGSYEENKPISTRDYWLTLYVQCLKATRGVDIQRVLQNGP